MRAAGFAGGIGPRGNKRVFPSHVVCHKFLQVRVADGSLPQKSANAPGFSSTS
jgi:hypothetical protein